MVITKDRYRVCQITHYDPSKIDKPDEKASIRLSKRNIPVENAEEEDLQRQMSDVYFS